jgi:cyclomaltodextrinase / maltogenic alpha-amylase / neopullulanase
MISRSTVARLTALASASVLLACASPAPEAGTATSTPTLPSTATAASAPAAVKPKACTESPYKGRSLYLRGSFNDWRADDAWRFLWNCDRFSLTAKAQGAHQLKVGDEDWSRDADLGAALTGPLPRLAVGAPVALIAQGRNIEGTFTGSHRFTIDYTNAQPTLRMESCPQAPFGDTTLFIRGSMNNWAALDEYAFQWSCDAYYVNVELTSRQEFKLADSKWSDVSTMGAATPGAELKKDSSVTLSRATDTGGTHNLAAWFEGEHTLKLTFDANNRPQLALGPKTFADSNQTEVKDVVALSLAHDTRSGNHKAPFGAVPEGTNVAFILSSLPGVKSATLVVELRKLEGNQEVLEYSPVARIPMQRQPVAKAPGDGRERWRAEHTFGRLGIYGYYFEVEIYNDKTTYQGATSTFVYQNNRDSVYWTREKGSNGLGLVGEKVANTKSVRRFRHTVHLPGFATPEWAKDAVYYYIFPDRFRNGDKANDPKPGVTRYHDKTVELHADWNSKPFRPGTGDGSDPHYNNDFYGGDLAGIIDKLDYIAELGANTIYMTPVFRAASNHKYDTADYKNIDPNFGTNADFERLAREAAKRGIRVVPDTSLNHTGIDSLYFDRFNNFGSNGAFAGGRVNAGSPYASWYTFDPTQREPEKQYKGWVGVSDLPEIDKASPAFRNFAYRDKDSVMKLWLDRGAAGWRMDVAPWVPDDFWREWRAAIKAHRPDAVTVAETWFDSSKYFLGDMFDSTMNYIFRNAVLDYANGQSALTTYRNIELTRELYPATAFYALMNLVSSHDQARALHLFGYEDHASEAAIALAKQRLRLATFLQMTLPGSPAIYYGDEVGVTGGDDPYNRATYPWEDMGGKPDKALLADVKRLTALRREHKVLRHGSFDAPAHIDANVIAWVRTMPGATGAGSVAIIASNNSDAAKTISVRVAGIAAARFVGALGEGRVEAKDGVVTLTVPARFGGVWVNE